MSLNDKWRNKFGSVIDLVGMKARRSQSGMRTGAPAPLIVLPG